MREEIHDLLKETQEIVKNTKWQSEEVYCEYLAQTYFFATHSVRLLALAAAKMEDDRDRGFQKRFIAHCAEEADHDLILIADLKKFGRTLDMYEENSPTRLMWQSQYYLIEKDPLIFMGYIIALEEIAAHFGIQVCNMIKDIHGQGFQFLKIHGEEDLEHIESAYKVINLLDEDRKKKILENAKQTIFAYNQTMSRVNDVYHVEEKVAA